ncbi:hypothetical protein PESHB5_07610 [Pediococcus parvulus]
MNNMSFKLFVVFGHSKTPGIGFWSNTGGSLQNNNLKTLDLFILNKALSVFFIVLAHKSRTYIRTIQAFNLQCGV